MESSQKTILPDISRWHPQSDSLHKALHCNISPVDNIIIQSLHMKCTLRVLYCTAQFYFIFLQHIFKHRPYSNKEGTKQNPTVSKFNKESTAFDLALLSCVFMSRLYLVLHSVMTMVRAERDSQSIKCWSGIFLFFCL